LDKIIPNIEDIGLNTRELIDYKAKKEDFEKLEKNWVKSARTGTVVFKL